ncbi:hypothetical protein EfmAA96_30280 (plasmid) [Enterococcus faecium]|nr:hypothetical protein EfmAA96_30280 [Enterococcus faecium]
MKRKSYDRWGIEITSFNRNIAFHVECDCGELAKSVYQKNYFYCPKCQEVEFYALISQQLKEWQRYL